MNTFAHARHLLRELDANLKHLSKSLSKIKLKNPPNSNFYPISQIKSQEDTANNTGSTHIVTTVNDTIDGLNDTKSIFMNRVLKNRVLNGSNIDGSIILRDDPVDVKPIKRTIFKQIKIPTLESISSKNTANEASNSENKSKEEKKMRIPLEILLLKSRIANQGMKKGIKLDLSLLKCDNKPAVSFQEEFLSNKINFSPSWRVKCELMR
jgi:hypothetical protein